MDALRIAQELDQKVREREELAAAAATATATAAAAETTEVEEEEEEEAPRDDSDAANKEKEKKKKAKVEKKKKAMEAEEEAPVTRVPFADEVRRELKALVESRIEHILHHKQTVKRTLYDSPRLVGRQNAFEFDMTMSPDPENERKPFILLMEAGAFLDASADKEAGPLYKRTPKSKAVPLPSPRESLKKIMGHVEALDMVRELTEQRVKRMKDVQRQAREADAENRVRMSKIEAGLSGFDEILWRVGFGLFTYDEDKKRTEEEIASDPDPRSYQIPIPTAALWTRLAEGFKPHLTNKYATECAEAGARPMNRGDFKIATTPFEKTDWERVITPDEEGDCPLLHFKLGMPARMNSLVQGLTYDAKKHTIYMGPYAPTEPKLAASGAGLAENSSLDLLNPILLAAVELISVCLEPCLYLLFESYMRILWHDLEAEPDRRYQLGKMSKAEHDLNVAKMAEAFPYIFTGPLVDDGKGGFKPGPPTQLQGGPTDPRRFSLQTVFEMAVPVIEVDRIEIRVRYTPMIPFIAEHRAVTQPRKQRMAELLRRQKAGETDLQPDPADLVPRAPTLLDMIMSDAGRYVDVAAERTLTKREERLRRLGKEGETFAQKVDAYYAASELERIAEAKALRAKQEREVAAAVDEMLTKATLRDFPTQLSELTTRVAMVMGVDPSVFELGEHPLDSDTFVQHPPAEAWVTAAAVYLPNEKKRRAETAPKEMGVPPKKTEEEKEKKEEEGGEEKEEEDDDDDDDATKAQKKREAEETARRDDAEKRALAHAIMTEPSLNKLLRDTPAEKATTAFRIWAKLSASGALGALELDLAAADAKAAAAASATTTTGETKEATETPPLITTTTSDAVTVDAHAIPDAGKEAIGAVVVAEDTLHTAAPSASSSSSVGVAVAEEEDIQVSPSLAAMAPPPPPSSSSSSSSTVADSVSSTTSRDDAEGPSISPSPLTAAAAEATALASSHTPEPGAPASTEAPTAKPPPSARVALIEEIARRAAAASRMAREAIQKNTGTPT